MTNSYQNLRSAQQKFKECISNVKAGVAESAKGTTKFSFGMHTSFKLMCVPLTDKPILIPLTSSLYVPGQLADTERVIVDVGTGFYVEKSTADATKFYENKVEELGKNVKELDNIVNGKANNLRMVEEVLRQKMLAQPQGQPAGQASAGA